MERLPDTEFDVMNGVWACGGAVTAACVMARLEPQRAWKIQTVIVLLNRLVERGFLSTQKVGRERLYRPLVGREDYLMFESDRFLQRYHHNSLASLVSALSGRQRLTQQEIAQLEEWIDQRKE